MQNEEYNKNCGVDFQFSLFYMQSDFWMILNIFNKSYGPFYVFVFFSTNFSLCVPQTKQHHA